MFSDRIHSVNFQAHTSAEVKKLSVKQITNPETYDDFLHPNYNGLYDPALGSSEVSELCDTCGMNSLKCPGHLGYIKLPLTIYHPLFFKLMVQVLRGSCFKCHHLVVKSSIGNLFVRQFELLERGYLTEANNLGEMYFAFASQCAEAAATDIHMEELVNNKVDQFFEKIVADCQNEETQISTKNIVHSKQQLVKGFMNVFLKTKLSKCPHCESIIRDIRSEYNSRVYFKSVGARTLNKALQDKADSEAKNKNESTLDIHQRYDDDNVNLLDEVENENDKEEEGGEANIDEDDEELKEKLKHQEFITPEEVKNHIIKLFNADKKLFQCLFGSYIGKNKFATPEIFFLDILAVPPSRYRPQAFLGEKRFENPQTANLSKILWDCKLIEEIMMFMNKDESEFIPVKLTKASSRQRIGGSVVTVSGNSYKEQLQNSWLELQGDVNTFMDSSLNKITKEPLPGVRQLLEKKEGLFRKNMMGKRVDYACRSVISPDPFINTDEVGVPEVFASKLTYVQPVTPWNLAKLSQMVINGPKKYPGAVMIEYEDGRKMMLPDNLNDRKAIAKQLLSSSVGIESAKEKGKASLEKKVYRHLLNGDILLLNRQPTLHRPSIMAHKARVLPKERTLRLHYANCKSYNADFDGDEMNAHFPQNELGRSEAYNIVSTDLNYLSPKDGKPLAGLIQDHIVSGVMMTSRDRFFNRDEYQQLIFSAFLDTPGRIKILKPCILKPVPKWSGKQVISTVIINVIPKGKTLLNMEGGRARIADHSWPQLKRRKSQKNSYSAEHVNDSMLTESQVIIRQGELMTGILDKTQYGAASYGIVHVLQELYGGKTAGLLLSVFGRLFTAFLQFTGFTLGIEDLLVVKDAEKKRCEILEQARLCGDESAFEAFNLDSDNKEKLEERLQEAHHMNNGFELKLLDASMKTRTDGVNNKVNTTCMRGLRKKFPCNALQLMVQSGAKGSSVNAMQISCLLGQIELEGRRPPLSSSGRSLPSFQPYDTSPRAGGFVDGRFLTGIRPQEYFFHCMAGREGLVDTAVKTSSSGYLQRCLIKHMEALYVQYDMTVRDGDGSIIQFLYGDDGIDVLSNQYLEAKQFKSILSNHQNYVELLKPAAVSEVVNIKKAPKCQRKCDRWKRRHRDVYSSLWYHKHKSPFNLFEEDHRRKAQSKHPNPTKKFGFNVADRYLFKKWTNSNGPTKEDYKQRCIPCPDPVLSLFNPSCYFGAVSEKFHDEVKLFMDAESSVNNLNRNEQELRENIQPLMFIKFMRSLIEPGEAVGLLASQSIGEPSTQMTLNTFHFAGRGDMNVTLGIPRLREILMTASKTIKTPQMDILVHPGKELEAKIISKRLNKLSLMKVLKSITVDEMLSKSFYDGTTRCREFRVKLEFLPKYAYEDTFDTNPNTIMMFVETVFLKKIAKAVEKVIMLKEKQKLISVEANRSIHENEETQEDRGETNAPADEPDDLADLSDDEMAGDGDASNMKEKARKTQFTSYDENEISFNENINDDEENMTPDAVALNIKSESQDVEYSMEPIQYEVDSKIEEKKYVPQTDVPLTDEDIRVQNVIRRDRHIVAYLVDAENMWCEVTYQFPRQGSKLMLIPLIEKLAEKAIIQESPGITRAMVIESKSPSERGRFRLKTEGVNINELWNYPDVLEVNSFYSNNIHSVAAAYGIEAARRVLIREVEDVFKVYGIHINPRHLSLVGDYMTFEGCYKPFNRIGIESNAFPFQKMSFETSTHFLRHATAFGEPDHLGSPSSRIVVGRVIGTGTGMCDLLPDISL